MEEVSAKTGEKVFDSIKDFGVGIARAKMEKLGLISPSSTPPAPSSQPAGGQSEPKAKEAARSQSAPSVETGSSTIKIGAKKGNLPAYQKKCC
jgi:hypothetical protein